jgi:hypothetical protein
MAQMITIQIADDGAVSVSVEMEGAEPQMMEFASIGEALEAIAQLMEEDPEAMWQEEATARDTPTPDEEMM